MNILKSLLPFLLVILLSYFAIKPFFVPGFFPMHDDTQVARVFEMKTALADGMFPVRWVPNLGYHYGYPIFNFYAPLAYYVGGFINLVGFDSLLATKGMMMIAVLLSGIFMYLLAKEFWGKLGGIIASLLYIYAPYHAVDIYVRGDVAEFWAYAFIPLAFYGIWKAYVSKMWKFVVFGSLGFAGIILSHNLTAMMVTPFLLLFAFVLYFFARQEKKVHKPYYSILILVIGVLLSSFYWLSVFPEMQYTNVLSQVGGGADYEDHFVCIQQLWNSPWGFGGSTPGCVNDGVSFKIGKLHLLLFVISLGSLFFLKKEKSKFWFCLLAILSSLFVIFLMLPESKFLWDSITQMAFIQFPWRFLLIATFFISFLGGALVWIIKKFITSELIVAGVVAILSFSIIYFNLEVFAPQTILKKTANDYTNLLTLRWTTAKISDEYMPKGFIKPKNANEVPMNKITTIDDRVKILSLSEKTQQIRAEITTPQQTEILLNHAYFPGWHVSIDGKQTEFKYFNRGLLVTIPEGRHQLVLKFTQTPIEILANIFSLTGVLIVILGIIKQKKEQKNAKKST